MYYSYVDNSSFIPLSYQIQMLYGRNIPVFIQKDARTSDHGIMTVILLRIQRKLGRCPAKPYGAHTQL